ncbi:MAG: hypothetical protein JKY71_05975 [Alphaproteobacteria bacterium]|nr:hypothetical protein [Alphaproteobacteria bacterium]
MTVLESDDVLADYAATLAKQADALGARAFQAPHFASVRDGYPPNEENTAVVIPEERRMAVLNGEVPDVERLHNITMDVLVDKFGPQQTVTADMRTQFGGLATQTDNADFDFIMDDNSPAPEIV